MAANQNLSLGSLKQEIMKLQREVKVLRARSNVLLDRFCLYWVHDTKPPAIGIVLRKYKMIDPETREKIEVADIFIISEHLSKADISFAKHMVEPDVPKAFRWEPLVLPEEMFAEVHADLLGLKEEEKASEDGNTALV